MVQERDDREILWLIRIEATETKLEGHFTAYRLKTEAVGHSALYVYLFIIET